MLVLGPLAVRLGGAPISVDGPLERALLARLALAGGMSVPDHRLAADLWGDVDLARPTERLRVLASRLRARLADELGVDPAPDTAAMELRLLRQDPTLLLSAPKSGAEPAAPPAAPAADLPSPLTSFVGRQHELSSLVKRLGEPGLVTLTGGPGSGKSRLSSEAARAVPGRVVRLVELAPLQRESAVLEAIVGDGAGGSDPSY